MEIKHITSKAEILAQLPLLKQLTKELTYESLSGMLDDMLQHDYHMLGIFESEKCVALSGYWLGTKLYSGKYLELDNVVVDSAHRSQGLGKILVDHIEEIARKNNCKHLMLDAYLENEKAHVFYEREGFFKRGYHFLKKL
ncbi:MAG TPA: GNAT family N-acetyltransferase [Bacteroidia bacterium]|jgi:GNAT superfamily N-acetyltransferase|nr:GNAT family N-acetyltransferase [Bacteroidia bacterium]